TKRRSDHPMWSRTASSSPLAVFLRLAQLTMLSSIDEVQDFRNRGIGTRQMPDLVQALGEHAGSVKQFHVKRSYRRQPLAAELAPLHADHVEARQHGVLAVDQRERDHIAAH